MDIKPYQQLDINIWTDLGSTWIILSVIGLILLLGGPIFSFIKDSHSNWWFWSFALGLAILVIGVMPMMTFAATTLKTEHYKAHQSQVKDKLDEDGFKVISGTLDLHPNTQSSLLLSYENKNFDCTLFTPEDMNTNIVFSCGEAKMTLNEIKESK